MPPVSSFAELSARYGQPSPDNPFTCTVGDERSEVVFWCEPQWRAISLIADPSSVRLVRAVSPPPPVATSRQTLVSDVRAPSRRIDVTAASSTTATTRITSNASQRSQSAKKSAPPTAAAAATSSGSGSGSGLKGQTVALVFEFNPPRIFMSGDNSEDLLPVVANAVWTQLPEKSRQALATQPQFVQVQRRCAEPVFCLELPRVMLNDMQQTAMFAQVLNHTEHMSHWRPHVADSMVELKETLHTASTRQAATRLMISGGTRKDDQPSTVEYKTFHFLFFVHL